MTTVDIIQSSPVTGVKRTVGKVVEALGKGFNAYLNARARTAQIEILNRKSDAELAEMGLRRGDIVHHVWRDAF